MPKILIVDDTPTNRQFLLAVLGRAGHRMVEASDGAEGLQKARAERPDLVITDVLMPTMDGVEFTRKLHAEPGLKNTPVFFYTATYRADEARALADSCGVSVILTKPSDPSVILSAVSDALGMRPASPASVAADPQLPAIESSQAARIGEKLLEYLAELERLQTRMAAQVRRPSKLAGKRDSLKELSADLRRSLVDLQAISLRLSTLVEVGLELASQPDPTPLVETFCRAAQDVVSAKYAAVGVLDGNGGMLRHFATRGMDSDALARLGRPSLTGVLGQAIAQRKAFRIHGLGGRPEKVGLPAAHPPIDSFLAIPIFSPAAVYGWLYLAQKLGSDRFSEDEERLVLTLSAQFAVAYENVLRRGEIQRRAAELEQEVVERKRAQDQLAHRGRLASFAADVGLALTRSSSLQHALQLCSEAMVRHLDAALARIWTLNDHENVLDMQASAGMYTGLDGPYSRVPVGALRIGLIAKERTPYVTNSVASDRRWSDDEWITREGMASFAGYPLVIGERLVGVIAMFARQSLSDATLETMSSMASAIALGIERRRTEEALRMSEERYRLLFERNVAGVFRTTLDGAILDANEACARMFGYSSREEFVQTRAWQALQPAADHNDFLAELQADKTLTNREVSFRKKDGTPSWFLANATLIESGDGTPVIEGVLIDITERKSLEQQLRLSQKLEGIGRLAGGVAHDFNNLLTVIKGYSDMLVEELPPELGRLRRGADEIHRSAQRAANLTRQLLAFSRKQVLAPKVTDLNEIVSGTEEMLRRLIGEDIELKTVRSPGLGRVKADPGQIEQVIVNLAVNSRDAMPKGGKFIIETANADLENSYVAEQVSMPPGRYVMMTVSDTGCGMDAATQSRVFEPFFTTKELGKGTGLGLATVYGIVKQSGGYIWLTSTVGTGATFRIYLPRVEEAATQAESPRNVTSLRGTETVLLVEDEVAVRSVVGDLLKKNGFTVLEALNVANAAAICKEYAGDIDLLLTDVVMPEQSGRDLADVLAPLRPDMRVLFMSGYTDEAIVDHGILQAGVEFIQKPFRAVELTRKIREVLGTRALGAAKR